MADQGSAGQQGSSRSNEGSGPSSGPRPGERADRTTMSFTDLGHTMDQSASAQRDTAETEQHLSAADQATIEALRAGTALLVVLRGPNTGARFLLDSAETTSGRHPDSEIFLDDVTVSRRHAVFRRDRDGFLVKDSGSLNGTYVNRTRIDEARLATGDEVQIGKFRLVYYGAQQSEA